MLNQLIKTIDTVNLKGKFLVSYPNISDNRFFKTIIYIIEHTSKGAEGLVINKNSAYSFVNLINSINNLNIEKKDLPDEVKNIKILRGGPVNNDKIFILHSNDYKNSQTIQIDDNICYSKNLETIESIINSKGPTLLSVFIGNCTWEALQLEEEIKKDTWLIHEGNEKFIFNKNIDQLWNSIYETLGISSINSSYFFNGEKTIQ